ncbi:MAG TPA: PLDc N-terminal domain-containing protein [Chitinophagaceae bacterium]|nr:PLDc N-terminal domain-containing protein [Chitinophagaceae bacterium]
MFFANEYFYIITLGLQAICVFHCIRRGTQQKWIWLIVFLPIIGSIAYIFTEMFSGNEVQNLQSGIGAVVNPGGRIKKLEDNLRFADTFNNKVALADAYLAKGEYNRAIELYESSLTNNFVENEHVLSQLIIAYSLVGRYEEIIPLAKKIYKQPQFLRSKAHICYIKALVKTGNAALAETEFKSLNSRFSNFEARYEYGMFLIQSNHEQEGKKLLSDLLTEMSHLTSIEKRSNHLWFAKAREALKK